MKARPILFSGPMVRALLAGTKTQTRRIVKPQPEHGLQMCHYSRTGWAQNRDADGGACTCVPVPAPYGVPGDLLWVRESIGRRPVSFLGIEATNGVESAFYKADEEDVVNEHEFTLCPWWKGAAIPSIHMPRFASRLTLEITDVRVERLQDISEEDALAEGIKHWGDGFHWEANPEPELARLIGRTAKLAYMGLWEEINGRESLDANPWVWAVSFNVHHQNVDAFPKERGA